MSSSAPTGTSTPLSPSRGMSPVPSSQPTSGTSPRKSSIIKLNLNPSKLSEIQSAPPNPSPMSDGEATGGEMSDGAGGVRKKGLKLRLGNKSPTPSASRAGSPVANGSRAGSPAAPGAGLNQGQSMLDIYSPVLYSTCFFISHYFLFQGQLLDKVCKRSLAIIILFGKLKTKASETAHRILSELLFTLP